MMIFSIYSSNNQSDNNQKGKKWNNVYRVKIL